MARTSTPSYTDLVYDVLRSAAQPLPFPEIFAAVERRRPITTRNPKQTVRGALAQVSTIVSLGDGRYCYLPHLVSGSLLRLPLTEKDPRHAPLIYTEELRIALWPAFFESGKRRLERPVTVQLPNRSSATLALAFLGPGTWGSAVPPELERYFGDRRARSGDALIVRVLDGEAGLAEAWLELRKRRDNAAVARRNRALADAALQLLRDRRTPDLPGWELVISLLARGAYRADVAPDPIDAVLREDERFTEGGFGSWIPVEMLTPDLEQWIEQRRELESELTALPAPGAADMEVATAPFPIGLGMERTLADLEAMLSQREFGTIEEANAFLQGLMAGGGPPARAATTPLERAQDLIYRATDAASSRERIRLAREALAISPDCADAYVLLAEETARNAREAAALYVQGVAAGERALGERRFKEEVGHFWGMIDTRPYMRARLGLAVALWETGEREAATGHLWEMLRLNPNDNQGVRYVLVKWLLEMGDDARLTELFRRYRDDAAAVWLYARALHGFRAEGDTARTRRLRAEALKENPHVPPYLLGQRRLPHRLPELIGFGDESEAVDCADAQLAAWRATPGALDWLAAAR